MTNSLIQLPQGGGGGVSNTEYELKTVQITFSNLKSITYKVQTTLCSLKCTYYTIQHVQLTLYNFQCTAYAEQTRMYGLLFMYYTASNVQLTLYNFECTAYNAQFLDCTSYIVEEIS